jgi:hypothetical protein
MEAEMTEARGKRAKETQKGKKERRKGQRNRG